MFLLAQYMVAAAVFLSASAASAVEDATPSADYLPTVSMLPACKAFIADDAPRDIYGAGACFVAFGSLPCGENCLMIN